MNKRIAKEKIKFYVLPTFFLKFLDNFLQKENFYSIVRYLFFL